MSLYHLIVARKILNAFSGLNRGQISVLTDMLAPKAKHSFIGLDHALSGTRSGPVLINQWYKRLFQLFPDIRFYIHSLEVSGLPWHTLAIVRWTEKNTGTDGVYADNNGINVITICWGKVSKIEIYTDTARLISVLDRLAQFGNAEAHAQPIVDEGRYYRNYQRTK